MPQLLTTPQRPQTQRTMGKLAANEFGRLAQGVGNRIPKEEATNTINLIPKDEVLNDRMRM